MKKSKSLVVIANAQEARIFEKNGEKNFDLKLLSEIAAELDSNHEKPGRTFDSFGSARHGIEPRTDRRQVERHKFAEVISQTLVELEKENPCDNLILMASHKILAELENALNHQLKEKITHRLAKDLVEFKKDEVKEYLEKNLE